jgi:hypothetical protein
MSPVDLKKVFGRYWPLEMREQSMRYLLNYNGPHKEDKKKYFKEFFDLI